MSSTASTAAAIQRLAMLTSLQSSRSSLDWIAAAIALLIWAPNLVWQVVEGFPSLTYIANHRGSGGGPVAFLIEFVVYVIFLLPLWQTGMISLFRNRLLRPIGIARAIPLLIFLFVGKSYYAAGTIPIALAHGLMAISHVDPSKASLRL